MLHQVLLFSVSLEYREDIVDVANCTEVFLYADVHTLQDAPEARRTLHVKYTSALLPDNKSQAIKKLEATERRHDN